MNCSSTFLNFARSTRWHGLHYIYLMVSTGHFKVGIVSIPYDDKSSYLRGAAAGPEQILASLTSGSSNYMTESGVDVKDLFQVLTALEVSSYDDILMQVSKVLEASPTCIFLGGDHSISYPILRAISAENMPFDILHFDAHTDLYDTFDGDRYSHACPFARIMEEGLCRRLVQVGIRTLTDHQRDQVERFGVEVISMRDIDRLRKIRFDSKVYISLDLDVFDPAYAPGVSHLEPGGMTPRQVIDFLSEFKSPVIGADIVELNPKQDIGGITAALGAKMVKELIGCIWRDGL